MNLVKYSILAASFPLLAEPLAEQDSSRHCDNTVTVVMFKNGTT